VRNLIGVHKLEQPRRHNKHGMVLTSRLACVSGAVAGAVLAWRFFSGMKTTKLTLHSYGHCPFCVRVRLVAGWCGVPLTLVHHGYGAGADPSKNEGNGYDPKGGPVAVSGKKELPVLVGDELPGGMMVESMQICSFLGAQAAGIAPATGRGDVEEWKKELSERVGAQTPLLWPCCVASSLAALQRPPHMRPLAV
jgi:glutaredoxin 2